MKLSDEFKVGILALVGLTILIVGMAFLKGDSLWSKDQEFYAIYEKIDGLSTSDPVLLNGFQVGKVISLNLVQDSITRVQAVVRINKETVIPKNTVARIISSDLLGEKAIDLRLGSSTERAVAGDTLLTETQQGLSDEVRREILPVKQKAETLLSSLDSFVVVIQTILQESKIQRSLNNFEKATGELATVASNLNQLVLDETATIDRILTNVDRITANLDKSEENISRLVENVAVITDSLSQANLGSMINNLSASLKELEILLNAVNTKEGTMGMLVHDPELYNRLNTTIADLDALIIDLNENPKRYVHFSLFGGGKDKKEKQ